MSMGSYLSDLHTHTDFSHGKGSPEDIVRAGIRCGLKRIAITEHAGGHVFFGVRGEKLTRLRKETERLASVYARDIEVLFGLECNLTGFGECDAPKDRSMFDVLLLAYHKGVVPRDGFLLKRSMEAAGLHKSEPELTAKALLAEAGYADGFDMEIAADSSASDTMTMALEIVSDQLAEVGIRAEIKNYDESTWLETRKSGELGSFMSTWSADYNDPDNFIYTFFGNEEKTRIRSINYPDTEVMERVAKARTIVNEDERLAEYKALEEKIIHEDAAWVPMFSRLHLFAVSKRVQG